MDYQREKIRTILAFVVRAFYSDTCFIVMRLLLRSFERKIPEDDIHKNLKIDKKHVNMAIEELKPLVEREKLGQADGAGETKDYVYIDQQTALDHIRLRLHYMKQAIKPVDDMLDSKVKILMCHGCGEKYIQNNSIDY